MKILLIEDDISLNTSLKASLTASGYAVTAFSEGNAGEKHVLLNSMDYDLFDFGLDASRKVRCRNLSECTRA
jgi:DNA-binding response OmpR family regulator